MDILQSPLLVNFTNSQIHEWSREINHLLSGLAVAEVGQHQVRLVVHQHEHQVTVLGPGLSQNFQCIIKLKMVVNSKQIMTNILLLLSQTIPPVDPVETLHIVVWCLTK